MTQSTVCFCLAFCALLIGLARAVAPIIQRRRQQRSMDQWWARRASRWITTTRFRP